MEDAQTFDLSVRDARLDGARAKRGALSSFALRGASLLVGLACAGLLSGGCRANVEEDPSLDRFVKPPRFGAASKVLPPGPDLSGTGPLVLNVNQSHIELKHAIAVAEEHWLHVVASASAQLSCDGPIYPPNAAWLEFRLDPGPLGDFYADTPTPVPIDFSIVGDNAAWREAHPAAARVQISSLTADNPTMRVELKRALGAPEPKVPTNVTAAGGLELTVCKSALELLGRAKPGIPDRGPATATFGGATFPLRSGLVFVYDDGKNATVVQGMALYEAERVSCSAAARQLSSQGGGIPGRQVWVGPMAIGGGRKATASANAVQIDGLEVTTGETFFEQTYYNKLQIRGFVRLTDADITEDPLPGTSAPLTPAPVTTGVAGIIHGESPEGRVSGTFTASVCRRSW